MSQHIQAYIRSIQSEFNTTQSTEHSFRSALKTLLESLNPMILALNESQRIVGVGMPDFTIKDKGNNTINLGWIEAKDLYVDLDEKKNSDQLGRYLSAFDNFIYTNNLTFNFYRQGKKVESVSLGTCDKKTITRTTSDLFADNIVKLERLLIDFLSYQGQTITSPEKLARAMAQKAQLIKYAIQTIFTNDEGKSSGLYNQLLSFQDVLVHDLTPDQFADMYAQTIAYGLFAARLYDPTLPTFSREEASRLIPKTNPFIRRLFKDILNNDDLDEGLAHIIDDLVNIFLHCNVDEILHHYGRGTKMQDPIIHFYETFLGEYDATMRKKRGVYYTPQPVVQFIVRGVDHLLQSEFGLARGLADTSKIDHHFTEQGKKIKKSVHRVQVLDPATGTGTFLNETINYIHTNYFAGQEGSWISYVGADLLPRLRGFEILMASYTMAHLKIGLTLTETGWTGDDRLGIYLTNSLEEGHNHIDNMFAHHLAEESKEASKIKREQPIMIVMGNPPYSVSSSNSGEWIMGLIADYKKDLKERSMNSLSDDYVKFIRFAESFVEKNGEGMIAMITNNSYLDGVVFRQMRKKLLETFDSIYIYDLHGNSKKKETTPDGGKDENVFDIMQGVSIQFFVKNGKKKKGTLAEIYHYDSYGKRDEKYTNLQESNIKDIPWDTLQPTEPYYFFVPKDFKVNATYEKYIKITDIFTSYSIGVQTQIDEVSIKAKENDIEQIRNDFLILSKEDLQKKHPSLKESRDRSFQKAKEDIKMNKTYIVPILYRTFDNQYTIYTGKTGGFSARPRNLTRQILKTNMSLIFTRKSKKTSTHVMVTKNMVCRDALTNHSTFAPLYLYNTASDGKGSLRPSDGGEGSRIPNLNMNIVDRICDSLGLTFGFFADPETEMAKQSDTPASLQHHRDNNLCSPEHIFDYIYAVLHSPTYRETYKEFLKIDFPRVPFTTDKEIFWKLVTLGRELRWRHLMEHPQSATLITTYPESGDNKVEKVSFEKPSDLSDHLPSQGGRVWINATQYIDKVPTVAREFYIGGYQPAQKRLKDRKGKVLSYDDIIHYQKIIVALTNTARVMEDIDGVKFL